jgi:hypothetical protein
LALDSALIDALPMSPAAWSYGVAAVAFAAFAIRLAIGSRGGIRSAVLIATISASAAWAIAATVFALEGAAWAWTSARIADALRLFGWILFVLLVLTDRSRGPAVPWRAVPRWLSGLVPLLLLGTVFLPLSVMRGMVGRAIGEVVCR